MSKLMILFVLFISGALYDPPRVLNQLGPGVGWHTVGLAHQDRDSTGPLKSRGRENRAARD